MKVGRAKIIAAIQAAGIVGDEQLISEIVKTARHTDNPLEFVQDYADSMALADGGEPTRRVPTALDHAEETDEETEGESDGETEGAREGETKKWECASDSTPLDDVLRESTRVFNDTGREPLRLVEVDVSLKLTLPDRVPSGYLSHHLDAQLKPEQAAMLKRLTYGLNQKNDRTQDGRHVHTPADAIRWLLENLV